MHTIVVSFCKGPKMIAIIVYIAREQSKFRETQALTPSKGNKILGSCSRLYSISISLCATCFEFSTYM
jgi:hypothetical protein